MPKPSTIPTLYDEVLQINITKLKAWGYLEHGHVKRATLTWTSTRWGGLKERAGRISIRVNMRETSPYVELDYQYRDEPRKYQVGLVSIPSNLGKGNIWHFLCPQTNKRCRKLYSIGGYFLHREAFNGCLYDSQTKSKKWREMEKVYGCYFDSDKCYQELYSKHFKRYYNGMPTKRYLKLKKIIDASEKIDYRDIERLMVFGP